VSSPDFAEAVRNRDPEGHEYHREGNVITAQTIDRQAAHVNTGNW